MLTRRRFLAATAISTCAVITRSGGHAAAATSFELPLPIPRLIDAKADRNVSLVAARGTHAYRLGQPVLSFGYSAPVLGPVVRVARGQSVEFTVENRTDAPTTVHWHGLVIPSEVDGGPHNVLAPGTTWKASLPIEQSETTAWFHPHPHGDTARQVYSGLAGMLLVEDGTGERLGLPRSYGIDDLPLILQDRYFGRDGAPVYAPGPMDIMGGYRGDTIIVNGVSAPFARVPASLVRLRLLNGANARIFDLAFSDRRSFHVVASDGGYLAAPVAVQHLLIAPGERYEVLIDFSNGAEVILATGPDDNFPMMGMMRGNRSSADGGSVMKFTVDRDMPGAVKSMPQQLVDLPPVDRSGAARRRQFVLNDMMMGGMMGGGFGFGRSGSGPAMAINGRPFDMERIDVEAKRGTNELWEIVSQSMAHPFHIHGTQFRILSLNGRSPPPHLQGWKDTVLVTREAQILVPFTQMAGRDKPFMYHCHILEHEDVGMMGQFACT